MPIDLDALVRGDKAGWDAFVDRYMPVVLSAVSRAFSARGLHDEDEIRDTVQDVFVRLVKNDYRLLRSFDPERASLPTWLTIVARSKAIDVVRGRRRTPRSVEEEVDQLAAPEAREPAEAPEIPPGLLTDRQRLILKLLFEENKDVPEVAALLHVTHQTVRSLKHKAVSRLREFFGVAP
jgi:RNA polymerase sigma-70 factor (ECF subfamily)